ncbi:efflux RND transporter permease subunit [Chitinophagaceae bacterium LWZ2-11]
MWYQLGKFILKNRLVLLIALIIVIAGAALLASKVKMGYDFTRAIPTDNPKYQDYQAFKQKFGDDGSTMVMGIQSDKFYTIPVFNAVAQLHKNLKKVQDVQDVLSVPEVINLVKDSERLVPQRIFNYPYTDQQALDSDKAKFENLPFYRSLLYNPEKHTYLFAITLNKDTINSKSRSRLIAGVMEQIHAFEKQTGLEAHVSGLPFLRTTIGDRIKEEMQWFLIGAVVLSAITLLLFFRSISATLMSLLVVGMGVVCSLATMVLFGYKITLLTAIIPTLIIVIGVPNCIYFLNKYHSAYRETGDKEKALVTMVGRMGIVTLFCNIAAAIGFAVFALTSSDLLKEFGVVSGINIMLLFFISLIFIPIVLSYLPAPKDYQTKYIDNKYLERLLLKIEGWAFHRARVVYAVTFVLIVFAVMGLFKLRAEGYVVDDLPKKDKLYTDIKWFESNFGGVMPLEIMVDTKKKNGLTRSVKPMQKIDEFSAYIDAMPETARPLSFVEALKFVKQAYFDGDSMSYAVPYETDMAFMAPYLKAGSGGGGANTGAMRLMNRFIDSNKQVARISINMQDIGSAKLPILLNKLEKKSAEIFDTASYKITLTGTSVTFLEGSTFIIKGLRDSIFWAFLLIALCMLYLFRSFRILVCSLIPNLIPLVITAGIMGWAGVPLKPSTVLVFSVALGIVIDVTIRFLINYKQELPNFNNQVDITLSETIKHTGVSIIYTSLVLVAGFVIFCFSGFGGTNALGWLTSLTLVVGTLTNLILLPVLIRSVLKKK